MEKSGRKYMPRTNGAEEKTVEKEKKIYSSQLLSREEDLLGPCYVYHFIGHHSIDYTYALKQKASSL